jgi:hypothetical protein
MSAKEEEAGREARSRYFSRPCCRAAMSDDFEEWRRPRSLPSTGLRTAGGAARSSGKAAAARCLVAASLAAAPADSLGVVPWMDTTAAASSPRWRMDPPKPRRLVAASTHNDENGRPKIPCPVPSPSGTDSATVGSAAPSPSNEKRRASKKRAATAAAASAAGAGRRTRSFDPVWSGTLADPGRASEAVVEPHTLILGTHPSRESLARGQYYAFPTK